MTRWRFILAALGIGAVAKGQQRYKAYHDPEWKRCDVAAGKLGETADINWGCSDHADMKPALNNQCPVCGTMAKPFTINKGKGRCNEHGSSIGIPEWPSCIEAGDSQLVRCSRCNNAFFVDSEK